MSKKKTTLTAAKILAAGDSAREWVATPEWAGGDESVGVYVRTLTAGELDAFGAANMLADGGTDLTNIRANLCVLVCVDEEGKRIFTDADAAALGEKAGRVVNRIFTVAKRLSGLGDEDVEILAGN